MQSSLQAVGVSPYGVCAAAILFTHPSGRILINCGENFQRLSTEWRLRLSRLEDILITHLTPDCVAGLPGLLLTLEGLDSPSIECNVKRSNPRQDPATALDASVKFGQTFVGSKWLTHDSPNVIHHYRPILKRRSENAELDEVELYGNSLLDGNPLESYAKMSALRHTVRGIRLWGPKGLLKYLQSFISLCGRLQRLSVEVLEYEDSAESSLLTYEPLPGMSQIDLDAKLLILRKDQRESPCAKKRKLQDATEEHPCVFESCTTFSPLIFGRGQAQLGRFLIDKAKELNIPRGPLYGLLKNGEAVTLPDGRHIEPAEVCEPSHAGFPFVIIRCQDEEEVKMLVADLQNRSELLEHLKEGCLVFHDSPYRVVKARAYEELVKFLTPGECGALRSLEKVCPTTSRTFNFYLQRNPESPSPQPFVAVEALNRLLHETYGSLCGRTPDTQDEEDLFLRPIPLQDPRRWKPDVSAPEESIDAKIKSRLDTIRSRVPDELLKEAKTLVEDCPESKDESFIQLLGTGASIPSKYRNVSSTLLQISSDNAVLLDCGEGTLMQLAAASANLDEFMERVESIKMVFLSHKHADHIMGLQTVAALRRDLTSNPLVVCAASEMQKWVTTTCLGSVVFMACEDMVAPTPSSILPDILSIRTCLVQHILKASVPAGSFALKLFLKSENLVVVFSGDLALDSAYEKFLAEDKPIDYLIQEATFEDFLKHEAVARQHCTVTDCMTAGKIGEAKTLIMTHFSQRYPTVPRIGGESEGRGCCVCYGMDLLRIPLRGGVELAGVYGSMKKMLSSLTQFFSSVEQEGNVKKRNE